MNDTVIVLNLKFEWGKQISIDDRGSIHATYHLVQRRNEGAKKHDSSYQSAKFLLVDFF
jgi:hypothetical protein